MYYAGYFLIQKEKFSCAAKSELYPIYMCAGREKLNIECQVRANVESTYLPHFARRVVGLVFSNRFRIRATFLWLLRTNVVVRNWNPFYISNLNIPSNVDIVSHMHRISCYHISVPLFKKCHESSQYFGTNCSIYLPTYVLFSRYSFFLS